MDDKALIAFLHRTGHFWNPLYPDCHNLDSSSAGRLTMRHRLVRDALASWQQFDLNFEARAIAKHRRRLIADGLPGPATEEMFSTPRCPVPDFAPPDGAQMPVFSDDPELQSTLSEITRSMRANATGTGSWPQGCDPQRPDVHSVRVNVDTSGASPRQRQILREALDIVERCEATIGQAVRHILDGEPLEAEHDIRFQAMRPGLLGFNYFPNPGTCRQTVVGRISNRYERSAKALAVLLTHEYKGHGDGLYHTSGGIMNPTILYFDPLTWIGDPHESTKIRYFGGDPIVDILPPPDPWPTMDGRLTGEASAIGGVVIRGDVRPAAENAGGVYIAVPDGTGSFVFERKPL